MEKLAAQFAEDLHRNGLRELGSFAISPKDSLPIKNGSLVLLGPDEPMFWDIFQSSGEYSDGQPDPMDRWSKRVIDAIAAQARGHALYPFGGPPFQPFYSWALRSGQAFASPISLLVHAQAGLFVSFRGAIALPWALQQRHEQSPCSTCATQACMSACPAGAFQDGYDVAACKEFLHTPDGNDCMTMGCAARRACPINQGQRNPAQAAFHMDAFL